MLQKILTFSDQLKHYNYFDPNKIIFRSVYIVKFLDILTKQYKYVRKLLKN